MALNKTFRGISTVDNSTKNYKMFDEELIKRDLLNAFMERPGERVMLGKRGCKIWNMLFEGLKFVINDIKDEAVRICKMESRITLLDAQVQELDEHSVQVQIQIQYNQSATIDTLYIDFVNNSNDNAN